MKLEFIIIITMSLN